MALPFADSLCHSCAAPAKYVRTASSLFIRCPIMPNKYPPQPVRSCPLYRPSVMATERLVLREVDESDEPFLALMTDSVQNASEWLARTLLRYGRDGYGFWTALARDSGERIGQIGLLAQTVDGVVEPELSYHLHAPSRGQGFAVEGARAVLKWAFARGLDHVIALIRDDNAASRKVAQKLEMTPGRIVTHAGVAHRMWRVDRR